MSVGTVLMSLPDAVTIYGPKATDGTVKEQEKAPVAEIVCEMQVCVAGVAPLKVNLATVIVKGGEAVLGENPVPLTDTAVPAEPLDGVSVIFGVVTVKDAVALSPVTVPTSLPETVTVYEPAEELGTVKVQVNAPVGEVVVEVHVCVAIVPPAYAIDPKRVLAENPEPVTVTETPTGPWTGDRVMAAVTANVADDIGVVPWYTSTKYEPTAVPGIVTLVPPGILPAPVDVKLPTEAGMQPPVEMALVLRQSL
ncbi:MAG: hypothetical protein OK438_00505 [Thaumarchaeota archaeon]|nr:hypothetical protein [Nitrososphaerota archaeon]